MLESHPQTPPQSLAALVARAEAAQAEGRHGEALRWLRLALRQSPGHPQLLANLGHAHWLADQPSLALVAYQQAVQSGPPDPVLFRGLANAYVDLGLFEEADRAYQRSWALAAEPATAWNHSQLLVGLERYGDGYALAEARWDLPVVKAYRGAAGRCAGLEQLEQGPLRVWSEQGLGDTLQHLRWLGPLLERRRQLAAPVVLEVEASLVPLLEQALVPQWPELVVEAKASPAAAASDSPHVSLLSLPHWLGGAPIPAQAAWLHHPAWLPLDREGGRIGIVWAAGRKLEDPFQRREYLKRSLSAEALADLVTGLRGAGFSVVNLQFGADRGAGAQLDPGFSEELDADADFAATAAVVAGLDLVISVDTAMAHLVGAMGRPGWVLLPWSAAPRWLVGRADSPWYPSLRLFRQANPGEWGAVVAAVLQAAGDRYRSV